MAKKISVKEFEQIKRNIIKKLYAKKAFSKGHLLFETLKSGIPKHIEGYVKDVLDELVKEGLIVKYGKTKHGDAYQLNIGKLKEIEEIIFQKPF